MRRIIRVFPRRTSFTPRDDYAFVGFPPMIRPEADEVHVSCLFTWDIPSANYLQEAWGQYYPILRLGGPAYDSPSNDFEPGRYIKEGVTFTSRGCDKKCSWCLVPNREGPIQLLPLVPGYILQDNNFLATPQYHQEAVFQMLREQKRGIEFRGGLDSRLLTPWTADQLATLKIASVFLACDTKRAIKPLEEAVKLLPFLSRDKLRCYVLIGTNTLAEDEARLRAVWEAGCLPYPQLWQPANRCKNYSSEWRSLMRRWCRPAITKAMMRDYDSIH